MTPEEIVALERQYATGVIPVRDLVIERGEGATLIGADGTRYLDLASGQGVAALGHGNEAVADAITRQARALSTLTQSFPNALRAGLAKRLCDMLPGEMQKVFFCNSGAEAVEGALKFSRMATGRKAFVACKRGFHGRTMGALSATWSEKYRGPFEPLVPGGRHISFDNVEALVEAVTTETACLIVEIVQGEGGVRPGSQAFFDAAQARCQETGTLLVVDEIQTGFARTGRWFASEHFGVRPDIITLAKAIGGGLPMGAVACGARVQGFGPGLHGSTFGGNPLSCAAAMAALDEMERLELPAYVEQLGQHVRARLEAEKPKLVRQVRGLGLMIGIELRKKARPYLNALLAKHQILAIPAGPTVLRILPPLVVTREEMDRAVDAILDVLSGE